MVGIEGDHVANIAMAVVAPMAISGEHCLLELDSTIVRIVFIWVLRAHAWSYSTGLRLVLAASAVASYCKGQLASNNSVLSD